MKKLIVVIALSLLAINPEAQGRSMSRADFVEGINILFLKSDYSALVETVGRDLPRQRLGTKEKKEILYLTALSYIKLGSARLARDSFGDILNMRGRDFMQDAYIGIADSYFEEKNFEKAIRVYQEVLRRYPRNERLSSVYYNLGLSYKARKDFGRAESYFGKLKERYDGSLEAGKLPFTLDEMKNPTFYIVQLGAFSGLRNAKKLIRRLARKKYDSYIQKVRIDGDVLYRVRAGKFSNGRYATRLLRNLRKDGFSAKIIEE
ncbi:MAG: SPOR domain-containing protein [Omnitrophica bacterium]|nr:SPOR domain-containing protein [Candidatus Omnitrophota bacterium]